MVPPRELLYEWGLVNLDGTPAVDYNAGLAILSGVHKKDLAGLDWNTDVAGKGGFWWDLCHQKREMNVNGNKPGLETLDHLGILPASLGIQGLVRHGHTYSFRLESGQLLEIGQWRDVCNYQAVSGCLMDSLTYDLRYVSQRWWRQNVIPHLTASILEAVDGESPQEQTQELLERYLAEHQILPLENGDQFYQINGGFCFENRIYFRFEAFASFASVTWRDITPGLLRDRLLAIGAVPKRLNLQINSERSQPTAWLVPEGGGNEYSPTIAGGNPEAGAPAG